jgi:hypothetical protein
MLPSSRQLLLRDGYEFGESVVYAASSGTKSATAFLLELIAPLQDSATVPMIDVRAYAQWLAT